MRLLEGYLPIDTSYPGCKKIHDNPPMYARFSPLNAGHGRPPCKAEWEDVGL